LPGNGKKAKKLSLRLWVCLIAADVAGLGIVAGLLPFPMLPFTRLDALLLAVVLITTCLTAAPLIRFLDTGWEIRFDEMRNRLSDGRLKAYLVSFWRLRVAEKVGVPAGALNDELIRQLSTPTAEDLFRTIYLEQYGQTGFFLPLALLVFTVFVQAVMIVIVVRGVLPLGGITDSNKQIAVAAIAGAFMFVIGDSIASVRRRSLNIGDGYTYALRMVVSIPLGIALSAVSGTFSVVVAFGLGTLPLDEINKLVRRVTYQKLNSQESGQDSDNLVNLEGVTVPVASQLGAEGVSSIDQLLGMDPVLLAIRTGLPFDLILRLGSQAIVGRYLAGEYAEKLPVGMADASALSCLVADLDATDAAKKQQARAILEDIAARCRTPAQPTSPLTATLEFQLRRLASDGYTRFLLDL